MDQRLKERQHYDEDLKKRQRAAEERERIIKQQKEREEAEELKKYRKTLDFKVMIRVHPMNGRGGMKRFTEIKALCTFH